ncbi:glutathione S-transferase U7-like [Quercus lobata]|uniref:glutathione transferase n=1 Tax=Quercus lobata TaxID=97700 RepID=A0A7N2MQ42_QUELO|nr:glutathione S-transferase U7-like [Quercus lobata]
MAEVKLIGTSQSLNCIRIEWALKLKGVEYELIEEDLLNKSPLLLRYNPVHKKVPVLLHHGKPIAESHVILEYIDETWKNNPLLPEDPYERSMARFWAKFSDEKCIFGVYEAAWLEEGEEKQKAIQSAQELLAILEKQIEGKKYFGGEVIRFLDLVVGWIPRWLNAMEEVGSIKLLDAERFPSLHEWSQNFIANPVIKECIPPQEKLVNYFNFGISYRRSLAVAKP